MEKNIIFYKDMIIMKKGDNMDLKSSEYVILEIIPTSSNAKVGDIAQLCALKIKGIKLEERFDYRLDKTLINIPDILNMINYDNDSFNYVKSSKTIMGRFKKFIGDLPLLIIDNEYTKDYLSNLKNEKLSVFKFLNLEVTFDVFDELIRKYNLEPTNHLVDLLYEALIMEL